MDRTPLAALQAAHAVATVPEVSTGSKQVSFWENVVPHFGLDASFNYALADQARHIAAYRQQIEEEDVRNARFHNLAQALLPTLFECAQRLQEAVSTLQYLAPEAFDDEAHEARWQADLIHLSAPLAKLEDTV